jgi:hypothetical protein
MATKFDLRNWIVIALTQLGGEGTVTQVCQKVWEQHESDLRESGDLFYTWQYDIRWVAQDMREAGMLGPMTKRGAPWRLPTA